MTVIEAIKQRRSIRKYESDPVTDATILQLLECARLAPSASNSQPWRFVVIKDSMIKKKLVEYACNLRFIEFAPCIIVCRVDLGVRTKHNAQRRIKELIDNGAYADIGDTSYIVPEILNPDIDPEQLLNECELDCAIATEHIVLAATAIGLGTCWIGMINNDRVHQLLNLPEEVRVVKLLALGYPAQRPPPRPRTPLENIILSPIPEVCTFKFDSVT